MDEYINKKIEFDIGNSFMADELNKQLFTKNDLSSDLYKQFDFKIPFDRVSNDKFGNTDALYIQMVEILK